MRVTRDIGFFDTHAQPIVLAAGTLDGVHQGHKEVVSTAAWKARKNRHESWVLTFEPHPLRVLAPDRAPPLLTSTEHKLHLLRSLDVNGCLIMDFTRELTRELASQEPEAFLDWLKASIPSLSEIVVGTNWTFGHRGRGNVDLLRQWADSNRLRVNIVNPILWKGEPVSSTRIREAVQRGELEEARHMLGRPFSVFGTVVPGAHIGRELGYPTANIRAIGEVKPPPGIYAVRAEVSGQVCEGAAYYGRRLTFPELPHELMLEVHLFDFDRDLYEEEMEVSFVSYVRGDRRFDSREALVEQIRDDCEVARHALKRAAPVV
jgi:riboflavin kinase/FMN adenylyltransferase